MKDLLGTIPELRTRPVLLAELEKNKKLQGHICRAVDDILSVTLLPDDQTRSVAVATLEEHYWSFLEPYWKQWRDNYPTFALANQLIGFWKNFMQNVWERATGFPSKTSSKAKGQYHVSRNLEKYHRYGR
jgi:hypothetical protein